MLLTELDKLVSKADKKRLKKGTDSKFLMKTRNMKSPSRFPKPDDAPKWTYRSISTDITETAAVDETAAVVATTPVVATTGVSTPRRDPTGGTVVRQILSEHGFSSSSESSSSDSDSD